MTTYMTEDYNQDCPVEKVLRSLSGKWKPQIFLLATQSALRFSTLMRQIDGINKQSLSIALREMEEEGYFVREVISVKPLHIEYLLTKKGNSIIPIFKQLDQFS